MGKHIENMQLLQSDFCHGFLPGKYSWLRFYQHDYFQLSIHWSQSEWMKMDGDKLKFLSRQT